MDLIHIIPTAKRAINFPKYVKKAPCQEVVITDNPTLDKFPILKCWPQDGGPFITLPLVFTRNPKTGKRNVGMYRLQKYDGQTTGIFIKMVLATIALIKKWAKIKLKLLLLSVQTQ